MRAAITIAMLSLLFASCASPRLLEKRVRKHPDRYVGVINALAKAAAGGDTVAQRIAQAIAPPPDTIVRVERDTVVRVRRDTVVAARYDTVAVRVAPAVDTVAPIGGGRGKVRVWGTADSLRIAVLAAPVVVRTRTVEVRRDSIVRIPEVRYVAISPPPQAKKRPRIMWVALLVGLVGGLALALIIRPRRR